MQRSWRAKLALIILIVALAPRSLSAERPILTLDQTLQFKWRGINVARMDFKTSLPKNKKSANWGFTNQPSRSFPETQIEISGETTGPLRWLEDYKARVRYILLNTDGDNAFILDGIDNGKPEQREIVFGAEKSPDIVIFRDSTAATPLSLQPSWIDSTSNPLEIFRHMLLGAHTEQSCAMSTWGYDGKRRYRLATEDVPQKYARKNESRVATEVVGVREVVCQLTMFSEGRQIALNATDARTSIVARRFSALWPFSSNDLVVVFRLSVAKSTHGLADAAIKLDEVRVLTPLGPIVGK